MCSISLGFQVAGHGADGFDKQVILPSESHLEKSFHKNPRFVFGRFLFFRLWLFTLLSLSQHVREETLPAM